MLRYNAPPVSKRFYITTAIDYVNGDPHLGHAYEKIVADTIARSHRAWGEPAFLLTGLDEHGQKVQQAAAADGKPAQDYCDGLAERWQAFVAALDISNNDFVRTTQPRHQQVVQALLAQLHAQGEFYKGEYVGYYSPKQESFLTERDRNPDGSFDPLYGEVIELREENYYFKLRHHQQWLIEHLEAHPEFVVPLYRRNEVLGFLRNHELEDLCISRPRSRLAWGIPLPFDDDYVTYVWFDALVNYLSVPIARDEEAGLWPADIHVIGKDILKFHAVYWPIMLRAAGRPLPRQVLVHGWWQKDGQKMSKSTGNVVDPMQVIGDWGVDAFRYYVLRELAIGPDGNWTQEGFEARYTAELANGLGNLVNRSLSMLSRYRGGILPARHDELQADAQRAHDAILQQLHAHELQAALISIWAYITRANQYVDQTQPFKLAKDPAQAQRLDEVLYNLVESCRIIACWLAPMLPGTSRRILEQLNFSAPEAGLSQLGWGGLPCGHVIGTPAPLFPRRDRPPKAAGP